MRSKDKPPTRSEILRNFTREFLIEEKRRCEIDRYVTDFRILIHSRPHENHNYLNRLLQDYTNMFLAHERISANKMNQDEMKHQLKSQLASRKKDSPKQRYVQSKLSHKNDKNQEHQSYLVLKAKTEEFLKKIRQYDELEQIAYEIFVKNSGSEIRTYQYEIEQIVEPNTVLKLKSSDDIPLDIPYKKHYRNVYTVNSPKDTKKNEKESKSINYLENYGFIKEQTEKFLSNNRDYNDAEQKVLSEQYQKNAIIKKYVDSLTSSAKSKNDTHNPKKGIYSKIKTMIGFSPEKSTKFYKTLESNLGNITDESKIFLRNERKYNNSEFEAYKLFYIKNGEFQNPLIEKIKQIAYETQKDATDNSKKIKIKHLVGIKNARNQDQRNSEKEEFEDYNLVRCSSPGNFEPEQKMKDIQFQFQSPIQSAVTGENTNKIPTTDVDIKYRLKNVNDFLEKQKLFEDQQRYYYVIHTRKYHINPIKERKEGLFAKIKHLFFGKNEKSNYKTKYFKDITQEFLKNEQYFYDLETQASIIFSDNKKNKNGLVFRDSNRSLESSKTIEKKISQDSAKCNLSELSQKSPQRESVEKIVFEDSSSFRKSRTSKKHEKSRTSPASLHQRSKSEDLLMFKTKTKSLDGNKSPTGHKSFSDRLKSMVGIGNRRRTKSRDNILRFSDPVQNFLVHERYYYDGVPKIDKIYGRSISSIEHMPKDGTIKTKTKKFLSTENVLYQDNSSVVGKPPTGRRRKDERNRDSKERRRSRTLSPAQKLVSKIRNLVHKNGSDKQKEDSNLATDEISSSDNKGSNDKIATTSEKIDDALQKKHMNKENYDNLNNSSLAKSIATEKKFEFVSGNKKYSGDENSDDPEFMKNQTRIFLQDIKKYHDLDKGPDTVDKTLIFINNKSESPPVFDTAVSKEVRPSDREGDVDKSKLRSNTIIKHNYSATETSHKVISNTIIKESITTQRITTEKIQKESIKKIPTEDSHINIESKNIPMKSPNEEHLYENMFVSKNRLSDNKPIQSSKEEEYSAQAGRNMNNYSKSYLTSFSEAKGKLTKEINKPANNLIEKHEKINSPRTEKEKVHELKNMNLTFEQEYSPNTKSLEKKNPREQPNDDSPSEVDRISKIISNRTDVYLKKQQKDNHETTKSNNEKKPMNIVRSDINPEKSSQQEEKQKKSAFSKLKTFVSGTPKKPTNAESNRLLRQRTNEFLDDMRKHHDHHKDAMTKYKVVWLEEKTMKATKVPKKQSEPVKLIAISEQEKQRLRIIRQNTDNFLKDHQDYHNRQRIEDNQFFTKVGQPEHLIWLSTRPAKKKDNIITKVKNLMSPQQSKKIIPPLVDPNDKIMRDQTDEFLRKHQYLIHKEELDFKKSQIPVKIPKEEVIVKSAEKKSSAPKSHEKSPVKEEKQKKSAFSKLKTFVSGTPKKPTDAESNKLLRQQTNEFLDDMRKHHDHQKDAMIKYKVVWLEEKTVKATRVPKEQSEPVKLIAISEQEKQRLRMIRKNTDKFLKDHQDYHNRQRIEDNQFFTKVGQPEHLIWLSTRPAKKKDNIITKVKNLISPQQSKKSIPPLVDPNDKIMKDQTDEFLRKHQYLIHKEELDFKKSQIPVKIIKEEVIVLAAEKQSSAPKSHEKSPEKEEKQKKSAFSKLKTLVSGTPKKPTDAESNKLLRQHTNEFLDDMRKHHDHHKDAMTKYKVVWLEEKTVKATKVPKEQSEPVKLISISEQEKQRLRIIRQNTDNFLKDHQDYHNRQRIEDNQFFTKVGQPEHLIWLSTRPAKKKDNIITKVKNLMSPQQSKKTIPPLVDPNDKIMRDQTDEFLRKHQYLIHKEELDFKKSQIPVKIIKEEVIIKAAEKQSSAPKSHEKSPEKEEKQKKSAFSKLKTFVSGTPKKPTDAESNKLLRQHTNEFLDDMRKHHDHHKDAMTKYKVVWLEEKEMIATKVPKEQSEPVKLISICEQEKQKLRMIRKNTDNFLKDHQDYHNRQRIEDNQFVTKVGQPEHLIWLSTRPAKKKDNIITKVKNLMSPQQSKKIIPPLVDPNDKIMRDQTDEFLREHQYLIHKEELDFKISQIPVKIIKEEVIVKAAEKQSSAPKSHEKSPEKEEKQKKSAFSKLKTFVSGTPKKPTDAESNKLLRQHTNEFLDDMRKHHDHHKDAMTKYNVVWLEEKAIKATKVPKEQSEPVKLIAISEQEKQRLRMIRKNTDKFLKDHQDYHNRQRIEDNQFFTKVGQPEHLIWLSTRPAKKKDNIITKVKNLISPQQSKKSIPPLVDPNDKIMKDQTDEFLRKHQYLIHKEELDFKKSQIPVKIIKEEVIVLAAEKQSSAPKSHEKSPEKEEKQKKSAFSKLKTLVSGTPKKPTDAESNKLLRQHTNEFLDDMRKHHVHHKDAMTKYKVVWLEEKTVKATKVPKEQSEPVKLISISEQEKQRLRIIRQNTDNFLKDHQDYHNRQRIEDNQFFTNVGQPEHLIWLSTRPAKKKDNIITKVKNLMSPQQSKKSIPPLVDPNDKIMRDQTDEFLRKHQYLIHKEELDFKKSQIPVKILKEEVIVKSAEKQSSAPKSHEKSPEKEEKHKKSAFSKLKTFVRGTPKKPTDAESNKLLRQHTNEFLDDMRKHHDHQKDAMIKHKVVWLEEKAIIATKVPKEQSEPVKLISISEQEKQKLRMIRKNTDNFLKDHQDYHNRQRIEDNQFFTKVGQPEHLIWLSTRPAKKKDNIITKVKNLMSPQQSKKSIPPLVDPNDKIMRDQTDEFLRKHQYLIHKEELDFKKSHIPVKIIKEEVIVLAAEKQSSAPKSHEKSPEKEEKQKKSAFSKLMTFVSGTPKEPLDAESNKLLPQQTNEFLDDMRKHHDHQKDAMIKHKVVWLEEKAIIATKVPKEQSEQVKLISIIEQEKQKLRMIRKNTDNFLKDHQDYHNRQRIEDNQFFTKVGQPEHLIWLSTRPAKKKDNIITKVKNLMSPQQSKKSIPPLVDPNDKIMKDQTDEFLRKHQYLIHKEELNFKKSQIPVKIIKEEVIVKAAEEQSSAPKSHEKSPEKEEKHKKSAFSKLKTFVSGTPKKPTDAESNKLLRQHTNEFLDDMRKHHDHQKDAMIKHKVVWLEEKAIIATKVPKKQSEPVKLIAISEQEKQRLRIIRQNTDNFLKDHQDYHNRQRIEDNQFVTKVGQPEHLIWLSTRPAKKKDNIITKVKNLMSPQQSKKIIPPLVDPNDKIMRDQTDEFLRKHQYLIHKEELDFKKSQIPVKIIKEEVIVKSAEKQSSAPKSHEKSPEKEEKQKKSAFSKLKTFVSGTPKKPTDAESNKLLRQQTNEFLDDMRKHHDHQKDAMIKYKVVWLEEKTVKATRVPKEQSEPVKLIAISEQEKQRLRMIRQNTDNFLKDHQDYHNRQRIEDNQFFTKVGQPEHLIWLSTRPAKKKDNIITKVKNLMSPQQSKKSIPPLVDPNDKIMRDQTDEFLRKHQYLIHKEELDFKKSQIPVKILKEEVIVKSAEKQSSAPKSHEKSPEKEEKQKKSAFSKLKTFVSGTPKKPTDAESNKLLRQQTNEFLDDMRKHHDHQKDAMIKYKVVWLEEKTVKATRVPKEQSEPVKLIAISEQEKQRLRMIRQNTDKFLKDHQDYHNRQRIEDNQFFTKVGQPEHLIWLSTRPAKKKDNIITKVKNLMSPQQSKKTIPPLVDPNDKIMRDQTDEFLRKHQYLIHKEELDFKKSQIPVKIIKEEVIVLAAEKQSSAPKSHEKSPEKEEKQKKSAFSKLKTFVSGTPKKPTDAERNKLLRQQTNEFLDDMRKHYDHQKDAMIKYKVVWLEEKTVKATRVPKEQSEPVKLIAISEQEKQRLRMIRQNTDKFLKDHQDYHNRQRIEDNQFFTKVGQPEHLIWLSTRPAKKKDNIITKVKNLMSPQQSKKTIPPLVDPNDKIMRDQTDEFLRKHQYLIHKEELDFKKSQIPVKIIKEEVIVKSAEKQSSAPKSHEKSPEKEEKQKKSAFSKLKTFVSGTPKKPTDAESNKLLRQQTNEFLDDMRKHHDHQKDAMIKYKVVWLEEKTVKATRVPKEQSEPVKLIAISEQEKQRLRMIRQNTDNFLKDHQDYHNRQRIEDNQFFTKVGQPEHLIWLSTRPAKKKDNIITKVKNLMSPQQSKKTIPPLVDPNDKIMRDQTDEFLRKHQYLIHKEELDFKKSQIPVKIIKEEVIVLAAEKQSSAPKSHEKSPEKEEKQKKSAFSKLKTLVSGTPKKPTDAESNKLLRQQTNEFLDDMRKHHDHQKDAMIKYKVVWLEEKTVKATRVPKEQSEPVKLIAISEQEKQRLRMIRQNTDKFLKDHQDYHNRQRIEDNQFFTKVGQPEHLIWLSTRPAKKKDNIITKVKNLMSPQQSKKTIPPLVDPNDKIMRDQTDEFLRKHQYLIHKEELDFKKSQIPVKIIKEEVIVKAAEKQSSAPKSHEKSPEKEEEHKKSAFSKLKTFVSGTPKKPTDAERNKLLRQQTNEFLDDMRKHYDHHKDAMSKYKVVWLEEKTVKATKVPKEQSEPVKLIAISEQEKQRLRMIRKNTDKFLKDHQDYHNRQRIEDNQFFTKVGQPEHLIWLSTRPAKKKDNIITKVENLMSPQQSKKSIPPSVDPNDKIMRDQTDEFLRKHQYLIHKEELDFKKSQISVKIIKEEVIIKAAEKQSSAPKSHEKSPEKEEKQKKSAFSKLMTFVSGTPKKPTDAESNKLLRQHTNEFLDDMRKHHDHQKDAMIKHKVVWLEEKAIIATKVPKEQSEPVKLIAISEQEKQRLRMIRKNTDKFLKDHQDYHNRQRIEDNQFFTKVGQPEHLIWLSTRPAKKKDNIITKVKNLMSPQQSKKSIPPLLDPNDKIMRDQTDEFLRKHQYLIHREECDFQKVPVTYVAEKQYSAPRWIKISPAKEVIPKMTDMADGNLSNELQNELSTKTPSVKPRKKLKERVKHILSPSQPARTAIFYYDTNSEMERSDKNPQEEEKDISYGEMNIIHSSLPDGSSPIPTHNLSLSVRQKKKVTFSQSPHRETADNEGNIEEKIEEISSDLADITSFEEPSESSKPLAVPRRQIRKKVNAVFIDSAEIFRQDKERYIIQETSEFLENHRNHQNTQWIDQYSVLNPKSEANQLNELQLRDSKPKPYLRMWDQVMNSSPSSPQNSSSEISDNTYFETRRNLLLFLDDHRAYHDRERNYFISFISKQKKPIEDDRKTTSKDPKLKTKFMSKIKSLVGHSEDNIASDKKRGIENALLRKQTLEFLISQKCYNDLEGDACYKFSIQHPEKRDSESFGSGKQIGNSSSIFQEDSTFCSPRKLSVNGSPESQIKKCQKPLKSSLDEKISKMDKIIRKEIPDSKINQTLDSTHNKKTNYLLFMEQSKNFLDSQRNHINWENKIWDQYLKYKPEAGLSKITPPAEYIEKSNKSQSIPTTFNAPFRKSSSQIESEKIDHEVILHKTKLFLVDHKSFHDNLQNELSQFASQQTKKPAVESKIKRRGEGVLMKVKSLLPSGHTKNRSYDIQKADGINQNTEGPKNIYAERKENLEVISSSKELGTDIKELTKNFLKNHQEYHNQEKLVSKTELSNEEEKEKKSKKGVISKIKSLVIGDSHKKMSSKKPTNASSIENVDQQDANLTNEKERISIRELTSSPETYRRSRLKNSQFESSVQEQKTKTKQEHLNTEKPITDKNEGCQILSISSFEGKLQPLEKMDAYTEENEPTNSEIIKDELSILSDQMEVLPGDEKKRYAVAKIKTQEFLLNEKQNLDIVDNKIIKESEHSKNNISRIIFNSNAESVETIPSIEKNKIPDQVTSERNISETNQKVNLRHRVDHVPSAPSLEECEELSDREKENIKSVIHRVVTPLSPTKTIFKEIRRREDSPDRKVYIVKEGYMITKENKDYMTLTKEQARTRKDERTNLFSSVEKPPHSKDEMSREKKVSLPRNFVSQLDGSASPGTKYRNEGQDYVDKSNDSPSQTVPQGDLEVRRHHTKNCYFIFLVVLVVLIAIYCIREDDEDEI